MSEFLTECLLDLSKELWRLVIGGVSVAIILAIAANRNRKSKLLFKSTS